MLTSNRILLAILSLIATTLVTAQPTTQPQRPGFAGGAGGRGEMLLQRFRTATADLNLTDDQKAKLEEVLNKAKDDITALYPQLQSMDPQQRQQKLRDFMTDMRQKIGDVLTDEQKQKLQEKLQTMRGPNAAQPGGAGQGGAGQGQMAPRIQQSFQRLQDSVDSLGLSGDQKTQVQAILDDGKKQFSELQDKVQAGTMTLQDLRQQSPQILAGIRDQLSGVLSSDQQQKLREAIQNRPATPMPAGADNITPTTKPAMKPEMMEEKPPVHQEAPAPAAKPQALAPIESGPKLGQPVPELKLEGLNERTITLSALKGKPLLIEFGSYTSPSFRQRASKMEEIAKQYGLRVNFLVIYTKEAHAEGEWEIDRNHDEGVKVAKHADLNARRAAAKEAKQALKLTMPMALDSMSDDAMKAFGAGENSAIVIGRDGKILTKEMWCDPFRLRAALDEALTAKPTTGPIG